MDKIRRNRRGETVMVTFRFPKELYVRLPVQRAPNAGKEAGVSAYLRGRLIEAVERDLATAAVDAQVA